MEIWLPSEEAFNYDSLNNNCSVTPKSVKAQTKIERSLSGKSAHATINCEFVPFLLLDISLPCSYPSEKGPNFKMSASWLNTSQLTRLCEKLDEIWLANYNMPVIYTWLEWLESNCLEFLDLYEEEDTKIILNPIEANPSNVNRDHRAVSLYKSIDDIIYEILRFLKIKFQFIRTFLIKYFYLDITMPKK